MSINEKNSHAIDLEKVDARYVHLAERDLATSKVSRAMRKSLSPFLPYLEGKETDLNLSESEWANEADRLTALWKSTLYDRGDYRMIRRMPAIDTIALVQTQNFAHAIQDATRLKIGIMEGREPELVTRDDPYEGEHSEVTKTIDSVLLDWNHKPNEDLLRVNGNSPTDFTSAYLRVAKHGYDPDSKYHRRFRPLSRGLLGKLPHRRVDVPYSQKGQPFQVLRYQVGPLDYSADITFHPATERILQSTLSQITTTVRRPDPRLMNSFAGILGGTVA